MCNRAIERQDLMCPLQKKRTTKSKHRIALNDKCFEVFNIWQKFDLKTRAFQWTEECAVSVFCAERKKEWAQCTKDYFYSDHRTFSSLHCEFFLLLTISVRMSISWHPLLHVCLLFLMVLNYNTALRIEQRDRKNALNIY